MRMRREATDTTGAKLSQTFHELQIRGVWFGGELVPLAEFRQFDDGQLENVPMELRTARRRNGLLEVSPTISA